MGICEEKSSGIDRVVHSAEVLQLPLPDFRKGYQKTQVIAAAVSDGLIKPDESVGGSKKFARYLPWWGLVLLFKFQACREHAKGHKPFLRQDLLI